VASLLEDGALTLAREAASVPEACCELSAPNLPFTNTGSRPGSDTQFFAGTGRSWRRNWS
jgi:hypothetical protein